MNVNGQFNPSFGKFTIRQAAASDLNSLSGFFKSRLNFHQHLDWRTSLEWLGYQPYFLLFREDEILAAIAAPVDPIEIAWIRVFGVQEQIPPEKIFSMLIERCVNYFTDENKPVIAALGLQEWFINTLEANNFIKHQEIVVLGWDYHQRPARPIPSGLLIRQMITADLPSVAQVDRQSFQPLWQNSLDALILAFHKASIATVAVLNGSIVGYQISTSTPINTHLARLAVNPAFQRQNIGFALVQDMLDASLKLSSWQISVNTQNDNLASLALYKELGFTKTGETFPVYVYQNTKFFP